MEEICSPHPTLSYSDHSGDDARSDGICSLHHLLHSPYNLVVTAIYGWW